ncbi:GNAT family protein [Asticcacaulis sp. 201]|uniref:GNAT family N-acetyltransferase n=1 Tax=Asticcacaulis sp. 201 TaxID=3028787 RepID=UPI002915D7EB|nr:GNAT family protein [Asticcacaulis sp. 201]MDV6332872.1 GNAT family protein [Asticcacaulis sp. 201]
MPLTFDTLSPSLGVRKDAYGNPVGKALPGWNGCQRLPDVDLVGRTCRVTPYSDMHADGLYEAYARDDGGMWSYLPYGPFDSASAVNNSIRTYQENKDFHTFVILDAEQPVGHASFMRYDLPHGSVEVGGVTFSPALRRSTAATEAMYLMMRHAFEHGHRRYEWKCNQLNIPSNLAALRLGFTFEGVFRNAQVARGDRRDTTWYSVIVEDWPQVRARLEAWLDPANFDANGVQRRALRDLPL